MDLQSALKPEPFSDPALTISLALAVGLVAQSIAHHLRIPGIVLLLAAGAILGPDAAGLIHPEAVGSALHILVGFAVAIILFEGGLNLNLGRLRRASVAIRQLVTIGAIVTATGGAIAAKLILGWEWRLAILFGTLVIVTGPTVISPLVRRLRLNRNLQTVLEAEGVLIDPVGAIVAGVSLEVLVSPSGRYLASGLLDLATRLGMGALLGIAGGFTISLLLRPRRLIPEGTENVFALSIVLALFHISNAVQPESGIGSVTVAGVVVGNTCRRVLRDLMEFKGQLTTMAIGMLFVLLAADVRFEEVRDLGVAGLVTVVVLMCVVRPLNIWVGTAGAGLRPREKAFLAWLAPRGIVAAAVASFFAEALDGAGVAGGAQLRAMVFLVIAVTVLVQGLTGGWVAHLLRVRRPANRGYVILGANDLGRAMGRALREGSEDVLFIDSNPDASHAAEQDGFRVVFGNAFEERTLLRAGLDGLAGCIGLTPSEEVNLLFATKTCEEFKIGTPFVALHLHEGHVTDEMVHRIGGRVLFGVQQDLDLWSVRLARGTAAVERWRCDAKPDGTDADAEETEGLLPKTLQNAMLPLAVHRGGRAFPADERTELKKGDEISVVVFEEHREDAAAWLAARGCTPAETEVRTPARA